MRAHSLWHCQLSACIHPPSSCLFLRNWKLKVYASVKYHVWPIDGPLEVNRVRLCGTCSGFWSHHIYISVIPWGRFHISQWNQIIVHGCGVNEREILNDEPPKPFMLCAAKVYIQEKPVWKFVCLSLIQFRVYPSLFDSVCGEATLMNCEPFDCLSKILTIWFVHFTKWFFRRANLVCTYVPKIFANIANMVIRR